jgi:tetratricopeptide (TPR) repeat protein
MDRLVIYFVFFWSGIAFASQELSKQEAIARAKLHMERGQQFFVEKRYMEAGHEFLMAYNLQPYAAFLYNAGVSFERMGDFSKAAFYFKRYLEKEPNATDKEKVQKRIMKLQKKIEVPPPSKPEKESSKPPPSLSEIKSLVTINTKPLGASITVRDKSETMIIKGVSPLGVTLSRGLYKVKVSHPKFKPIKTSIDVRPGKMYVLILEMSQGKFLGFIEVKSDIPKVDVYIDSLKSGIRGKTPFSTLISTGVHTIYLVHPGYQIYRKKIKVKVGEVKKIEASLKKIPYGILNLASNLKGASVYIDGRFKGRVPLKASLPPGQHIVKVAHKGYKEWNGWVKIKKGKRTDIGIRLNPSPSRIRAWVAFGISSVIFIGAGILGYNSMKIFDQLQSKRSAGILDNNDPHIREGRLWALGADIGFSLAAIVGGLGLYYLLYDPIPHSKAKIGDPVSFLPPEIEQ